MPSSTRLLSLMLALTLPCAAADRKAFTIEDLYRLKEISHLSVAPDGSKVLFEVGTQDLKAAKRHTNLWMADLTSGAVKQLTFTEAADTDAAWSRDGKTITFVSTREAGPQLWVMDASGGEARKATSFGPGVASPRLLPDGMVVFQATVFPEAMADGDLNAKLAEKLEKGPVQAHISDTLMYRHWTEYRDFQFSHLFTADLATGKVEAITSGARDFPGYGQSFDLSPDGKELCLGANSDPMPAKSTNQDLYLVNLQGDRTPVRITDNPAFDGDPRYSPDGRWIAYKLQRKPGFESDRFLLAVYDRVAKSSRILTESIDNWVDHVQWSADGRSLWFTVQEKGKWPLYQADPATGKLQRMLEGQSIREFVLAPDAKSVLFTRTTVGEPIELWRYAFAKKELKRLTGFNDEVAKDTDIRPAEALWVKGAGGDPVEVFLVKPHDFDPAKKYPIIVNVHGGPQMMWADTFRGDWQVYPGAGYIVAFPNPHGSTGYGQAFTDAISGDWDGKVMTDIEKVADQLAALPYVDATRMGAMGWSWGGYAMMWLEGHTSRFKVLAAMMGVYDLRAMHGSTEELWFPEWDLKGTPWGNPASYERMNPSSHVAAFKTPCLVITGEKDYRVPYTQSLQFFTGLQEMGVDSRLIVFKNDGHWPNGLKSMPVYYNAHLEWFAKYLGGAKAPWSTETMIRNQVFEPSK